MKARPIVCRGFFLFFWGVMSAQIRAADLPERLPLCVRAAQDWFDVGDVDGDGDLDILAVDFALGSPATIAVAYGQGPAGFNDCVTLHVQRSVAVAPFGGVIFDDFTGDGRIDVMLAHAPTSGCCDLDPGDPIPPGRLLLFDGAEVRDAVGEIAPQFGSITLTSGDLDADGFQDVVFGAFPKVGGDIRVARGDGAGGFNVIGTLLVPNVVTGLKVKDLDRDGALPVCLDAGDANDTGKVDIADAITILSHLFAKAGPLPTPFGKCGNDPTNDDLGCSRFPPCEGP